MFEMYATSLGGACLQGRNPNALQRTAKELEQLEALQQVRQAAADSAELMAPVARRKVRKEIEKVIVVSAAWMTP